jgi:hypothetical protein
MRKSRTIWCVLFVLAAVCVPRAQEKPQPPATAERVGTWTGTWEGAGAGGGFELTLEQVKDGPLTGRVAVTGEPAYKAVFKSVAFDGKRLTATYDFPPDESVEISLAATAEGHKLTGTWAVVAKGDKTEVASGSWTATKPPAKQ